MRNIKYLFFHTAAADLDNVDARRIDRWHRDKGWNGIGYHYVIIDDRHRHLQDGELQAGRPEAQIGAHVLGVNEESIGICCVGHGDLTDFTPNQKTTLVRKLAQLARQYRVPVKNILGHREVNVLISRGEVSPQYRTDKSCPGRRVSTDQIRRLVSQALNGSLELPETGEAHAMATLVSAAEDPIEEVKRALGVLAANEQLLGNALPEWRALYFNGEIRSLMEASSAPAES